MRIPEDASVAADAPIGVQVGCSVGVLVGDGVKVGKTRCVGVGTSVAGDNPPGIGTAPETHPTVTRQISRLSTRKTTLMML